VFANEVRAIKNLCDGSNENIITVFQYGRLRPAHNIYFIDMEWCDTSLHDYVIGTVQVPGLFDWSNATKINQIEYLVAGIMNNVLNGLVYIHSRNEVHRDLTPQNS